MFNDCTVRQFDLNGRLKMWHVAHGWMAKKYLHWNLFFKIVSASVGVRCWWFCEDTVRCVMMANKKARVQRDENCLFSSLSLFLVFLLTSGSAVDE